MPENRVRNPVWWRDLLPGLICGWYTLFINSYGQIHVTTRPYLSPRGVSVFVVLFSLIFPNSFVIWTGSESEKAFFVCLEPPVSSCPWPTVPDQGSVHPTEHVPEWHCDPVVFRCGSFSPTYSSLRRYRLLRDLYMTGYILDDRYPPITYKLYTDTNSLTYKLKWIKLNWNLWVYTEDP